MSTHRLPVPGRLASAGKHWGGPGPRTLLGALALVVLLGAECQPVPTPTPGATGGAAPVASGGSGGWEPFDQGGAMAVGGKAPKSTGGSGSSPAARCKAAKTADPTTKNVAQQSGVALSTLVNRVCSDPVVLESYQ